MKTTTFLLISVIVFKKPDIKTGCVVAAYAQQDDEELFWLARITKAGPRKIEALWLNKESCNIYGNGDPCSLVWNNVVRATKTSKEFYVLHLEPDDSGKYLLSSEAFNLLQNHCR